MAIIVGTMLFENVKYSITNNSFFKGAPALIYQFRKSVPNKPDKNHKTRWVSNNYHENSFSGWILLHCQ